LLEKRKSFQEGGEKREREGTEGGMAGVGKRRRIRGKGEREKKEDRNRKERGGRD